MNCLIELKEDPTDRLPSVRWWWAILFYSWLPDPAGHSSAEVGATRGPIRLRQRHLSGCGQLLPARDPVRGRGLGPK